MLYTKRLPIKKDYQTFYVNFQELRIIIAEQLIPEFDHESIPIEKIPSVIMELITRGFSSNPTFKAISLLNNEFESVRLRNYFDAEVLDELIHEVKIKITNIVSELTPYNRFEYPVFYWFLNSSMVLIKIHNVDIEEIEDD